MADAKLSALSTAGAFSDSDLLYIVQGSTSLKTTYGALRVALTAAAHYTEVANFAALPSAATHSGETYVCVASQGSNWLLNLKDAGFYRSNGTSWNYLSPLGADYFTDSVLSISDNVDPTKIITFQLSSLSTVTTRVVTWPDADITVVGLATTQALTNKTVNKLTITAPATGSTLTVDDGKTLRASNSLTFTGADGTTMTFPPASASIGYLNIPQNSISTAYTTVLADAGKHLYHPSADTTARTWTIDSNANVAYPIGTALTFVNDSSAGVLTIAITTDTLVLAGTGTTGSRTLAADGVATAIKMTSTRWQINGTGLT